MPVSFVADGRTCSAPEGVTVLRACRDEGIDIPTLCHRDGITPAASCRLCLVEIEGLPQRVPACATTLRNGMRIATASDDLQRYRRSVVEMLFAGGDHVCAFCPASGRCELQELCRALGLDHVRLGVERRSARLDASHPRFGLDPGRCVLCTRCVRVCAEVERAGSLLVAGRGRGAHVATDGGARWSMSATCTSCGRCVEACPTGALFDRQTAAQRVRAAPLASGLEDAFDLPASPARARLATLQLGGCAGCHMSLLDGGAAIAGLAQRADLVYSPLADAEVFPERVDACLVEGAVATEDELELLRVARERSALLVALGDCAGWGNVTAMRDAVGVPRRGAVEGARPRSPSPRLPRLLSRVRPVGEVVRVDAYLPGCPPDAGAIVRAVAGLVSGRVPRPNAAARFG